MARYRKPRPTYQERRAKKDLAAISINEDMKSRSYIMINTKESYRFGRALIEEQIKKNTI